MSEKALQKKIKIFLALITLIFVILVSRLAFLQLIQAQEFKTLSEQNRIRLVTIPAKRGEILDRSGKVILAKDRPVYSVSVSYLGINGQDLDQVTEKLAGLLGINEKEIKDAVKDQDIRKFEPIKIARDVPLEIVTRIEENRAELPGVSIDVEPMRQYVYGDFMAHILGYMREITPAQMEKHKDDGYGLGDRFGQAGLENVYENYLRGQDGDRLVEVDKSQHPVRLLDIKGPVPGSNLVLNIDYNLQKVAEESMDRVMSDLRKNKFPEAKAGAIVMLDVNSGKVLAMSSKPGFDPNIFNGKISTAQSEALFGGSRSENPFPAFNNRAMMAYPPGSTFKMVTTAAALETNRITLNDTYYDPGSVYLYGRSYKCWKPSGHGTVNLIKAIQVSCNVYFYQVGLKAGVDNLVKYAREFGLGQKTGIDLPNEGSGLAPSPEWKKNLNEPSIIKKHEQKLTETEKEFAEKIKNAGSEREKKSLERQKQQRINQLNADLKQKRYWNIDWREYETINMSIGQGYNLYTPLQLANYVAAIANGGTRYQPYLVDRIVDYKGNVVQQFEKKAAHKAEVSADTLAAVRRGMRAVTQPGGTAYGIFSSFPVEVAGKTGTAQTGKDKNGKERPTHGWFVAYAPYDKPEVAVAAIVENGGHGGTSAGLVVRDLLGAYFKIDKSQVPQGGISDE